MVYIPDYCHFGGSLYSSTLHSSYKLEAMKFFYLAALACILCRFGCCDDLQCTTASGHVFIIAGLPTTTVYLEHGSGQMYSVSGVSIAPPSERMEMLMKLDIEELRVVEIARYPVKDCLHATSAALSSIKKSAYSELFYPGVVWYFDPSHQHQYVDFMNIVENGTH